MNADASQTAEEIRSFGGQEWSAATVDQMGHFKRCQAFLELQPMTHISAVQPFIVLSPWRGLCCYSGQLSIFRAA
jgi:hypothetical protein